MSHDSGAPPMIQQLQLLDEAGQVLVRELQPGKGTSLRYETSSLIGYAEHIVYVEAPDGTSKPVRPPHQLIDTLKSMRDVMYRPGSGTWFSATITVSQTGGVSADLNYDNEPLWETPIDPVFYVQDLKNYPRDHAAIPDWLRRRLAEAL